MQNLSLQRGGGTKIVLPKKNQIIIKARFFFFVLMKLNVSIYTAKLPQIQYIVLKYFIFCLWLWL